LLNVLDVSLELGAELLQMLNDGTFDSLGQVGVSVGD
jgi:transcriptional regulator of aromatic amino acid metabolism